MIYGRILELRRLHGLLDRARRGSSGALIVYGDPGIGKSALLTDIAAAASDFRVLCIQPLEAESELAFAGLADLVRPVVGLLQGLPDPQRAALEGALALGPPAPGDRFAVAAATLSLLAAQGEASPVLAIVDDAHCLDTPSREALLFAGRRLGREGVVLVFGMRERDWLRGTGLDSLELGGLSAVDAHVLLDSTGVAVDPRVRERIVTETGGNPLAILEALASLPEAQLCGTVPLAHPLSVGKSLEGAFAEQLQYLPSDTQRALLVAAASDSDSASEIGRALTQAGLPTTVLEPAETHGIVALDRSRIVFRHPLVRSAAYHMHEPGERRAAHRALAAALPADSSERAAWHLAAASTGPDVEVAALLERSATQALERNAYAAAARAFEESARLSADDSERLRRTMGAGRALWFGGEPQAATRLLEGVLDLATDPAARADLQALRGAAMTFSHPVSETYAMLVGEADRIERHDPARAVSLLTTAAMTQFMAANQGQAHTTILRALNLRVEGGVGTLTMSVVGMVQAVYGEVDKAIASIEPLLDHLLTVDPLRVDPFVLAATSQTLTWTEQWDHARTVLDRVIDAARTAGAPSMLPFPLAILADDEFRRGNLMAAYAAATASVQLAADTGQVVESSFSLVLLARVEATLGLDEKCRAHVAAALDIARRLGARSIELFAAAALGLLELSLARADRAAVHLRECQHLEKQLDVRIPTIHKGAADYIEACVRSGALEEAKSELTRLEHRAALTGLQWPAATAARCRGLLADENIYEEEFATALELHSDDMAFERARTLLCLGMRRRRSRRRADARAALHDSLAYFESTGAEPWVMQARAELRASGETPAPSTDGSLRDLTPQELQVALVVAKGATNKEAASALFLSPKTIEFHLHNTYTKLGIRSRVQLVRLVVGLENGTQAAWKPS